MGQRTQIIYQKVNKAGAKTTQIFHLQWGYGRQMPLHFMRLVIDDYLKTPSFNSSYNFLSPDVLPMHFSDHDDISKWIIGRPAALRSKLAVEGLTEERQHELEEYLARAEENIELLNNLNIEDISSIRPILDRCCDNNNGVMLIQAREGNYEYDSASFSIGFIMGPEDTDSYYTEILPPDYYFRNHGGSDYCDTDFRLMFKQFCDYFGVKIIGQE